MLNIENKRQIATVMLAVALGFIATFLTSFYVKNSIENQTKKLAKEYEKQIQDQKAALARELEMREENMNKKILELVKMQQQQQTKAPKEQPKTVPQKEVFSANTPEGKRALTVMIDSLSAVGGLLNPGDSVDIIGSLKMPDPRDPKGKTQELISVLFQNVQVLAVDTNFRPGADESVYRSQQKARSLNVTLAVDPEEAGLLTFVQANGKLQLSLRAPAEKGTQNLQVASWDALSDYVLERQGTELTVPQSKASIGIVDENKDEVQPFIQIFRGGREGGS